MDKNGKWVLRVVVHHTGESTVGEKFEVDTPVDIPLSANTEGEAKFEAVTLIRKMNLETIEPYYESADSIVNEDFVSVDDYEICFSKKISRPRKILQQYF